MKILIISAFPPYDGVGHAGGKTVNYYLKRFSEDDEVYLMPFVTKEFSSKLNYDEYKCQVHLLNYGYSFQNKVIRKILTLYTKYNPLQKYRGLYNSYDEMLLKKGLRQLKASGYYPDVVILEWTQCVLTLDVVKKHFPNTRCIASEHDFTTVGYKRKLDNATEKSDKKFWKKQYEQMRKMELDALDKCDLVAFHSLEDLRRVKGMVPKCDHLMSIVPYYDDYSEVQWNPTTKNIIFFGAMNRAENVESACWFYDSVFTKLSDDDIRFVIMGSKPDKKLLDLAEADERVVVTGFVEDIIPWLENAMCMVAPLVLGAGIKVKVLEALSAGIPLLTNSIGMEGIDAGDNRDYFKCETAEEYINILETKIKDREITKEISTASKLFVTTYFDLEKSYVNYRQRIVELLQERN